MEMTREPKGIQFHEAGQVDNRSIIDLLFRIEKLFSNNFINQDIQKRVEALDETQRTTALKSLLQFTLILEKAQIEKIPIKDTNQTLKFWLNQMKLTLPFEPEDYITSGDLVEVYDLDLVQIYRNHTFYDFCSYDPLTLSTVPFPTLFRREERINELIFSDIKKCLTTSSSIFEISTPTHSMQEHYAQNSRVYQINHKYCSPVFSATENKRLGFICTQRAEYVGDSNVTGMGRIFN